MKLSEMPPNLNYALVAILFIMTFGATFYHYVEHWEWIDAALFATSTITTVGYGNIMPQTGAGKAFTIAYMIVGIGITLYALSMIGGYYMEQRFEQRAFRAAVRPREHIKKIKCLITPGSGDCAPQQQQQPPKKRNKDLFGNVK